MADASGKADLIGSIIGGMESLLGTTTKGKTKQKATGKTTSKQDQSVVEAGSEQLVLDPAAVTRIIEEVLSGPEGLASIFAGEQTAGIFNSTVASQAAGNLTAKLVGEIAKITGETVTGRTLDSTTIAEQIVEQEASAQTEQKDKGLIGTIGDKLGF